jgi:hypothetical protein
VAAATRDATQQRQLIDEHKHAVEQRVDRVVDDINELKDVKSRLRREGPRLAAIGGAIVVLVAGSIVLRAALRRRRSPAEPAAAMTGDDQSLSSLVAEIRALREEMGKQRKSSGAGGLAGKLAVTAVSAAASSAGKQAANRLIERQESTKAA